MLGNGGSGQVTVGVVVSAVDALGPENCLLFAIQSASDTHVGVAQRAAALATTERRRRYPLIETFKPTQGVD